MKERLAARWKTFDPRVRRLAVLAVATVILVEIWVLALRPPVQPGA